MMQKHWIVVGTLSGIVAIVYGAGLIANRDVAGRVSMFGTVTLNGQPIERGRIRLSPDQTTAGPPVVEDIEDGSYRIRATEDGLRRGNYSVMIISSVLDDAMKPEALRGNMDEHASQGGVVPAALEPFEWPIPLQILETEGEIELNFELPPDAE